MSLGLLNPLYVAVTWVLVRLHAVVGAVINPNSGLAWVLALAFLVILMRLVLLPLFIKQMHATRKMAALAPQLQELRKKYKNDKQTLNEQTMKLYRDNGVNPLGGCLPLVAQLPLFFALFGVLRAISTWKPGHGAVYGMSPTIVNSFKNANIFGAHIYEKVLFTGTLHVPAEAKIVILCAVVISVVTTFLTVRQSTKRGMNPGMTPDNPMAASQKYMTYIVPFFALSGLYWQFGLVLYWMMTNIWTLGQQHLLFKRYPNLTATPAPAGGTAAPGTGKAITGKKPAPGGGTGTPGKQAADGQPPSAAPAKRAGGTGKPSAGASPRKSGPPAGRTGTPPAAANGGGLLRRLGRNKPEPEPGPAQPEVKLVRQQRTRQSRSKRSGKR